MTLAGDDGLEPGIRDDEVHPLRGNPGRADVGAPRLENAKDCDQQLRRALEADPDPGFQPDTAPAKQGSEAFGPLVQFPIRKPKRATADRIRIRRLSRLLLEHPVNQRLEWKGTTRIGPLDQLFGQITLRQHGNGPQRFRGSVGTQLCQPSGELPKLCPEPVAEPRFIPAEHQSCSVHVKRDWRLVVALEWICGEHHRKRRNADSGKLGMSLEYVPGVGRAVQVRRDGRTHPHGILAPRVGAVDAERQGRHFRKRIPVGAS